MADPTIFKIPRRRMSIGDYIATDTELVKLRDVGVIEEAEVSFAREENPYNAVDLSGGECREYVADRNLSAGVGTLTVQMMSKEAANLGVMLSSAVTTEASGPATQETMPTMAVNDVVQTNFIPDPSTIVIQDSDASPATLVLGTDYEFVSKNSGKIRVLNLGSYVQPFVVDYTKIDQKTINPMSNLDEYFYIVFSGANERNSCSGEFERFYRCHISEEQVKRLHEPATQKVATPMPVTFMIDRDPNRSYEFGKFFVTEA